MTRGSHATVTILAVDDDSDVLNLIETALRQEGVEVLLSTDPQQALEIVNTRRPGIVLLDLVMPGLSGMQVREDQPAFGLARIRARTPAFWPAAPLTNWLFAPRYASTPTRAARANRIQPVGETGVGGGSAEIAAAVCCMLLERLLMVVFSANCCC